MVSAAAGNNTSELTTNGTTAHFSDLTCGQTYGLTVAPHNQRCPGTRSAPAAVQTCRLYTSDVSEWMLKLGKYENRNELKDA